MAVAPLVNRAEDPSSSGTSRPMPKESLRWVIDDVSSAFPRSTNLTGNAHALGERRRMMGRFPPPERPTHRRPATKCRKIPTAIGPFHEWPVAMRNRPVARPDGSRHPSNPPAPRVRTHQASGRRSGRVTICTSDRTRPIPERSRTPRRPDVCPATVKNRGSVDAARPTDESHPRSGWSRLICEIMRLAGPRIRAGGAGHPPIPMRMRPSYGPRMMRQSRGGKGPEIVLSW